MIVIVKGSRLKSGWLNHFEIETPASTGEENMALTGVYYRSKFGKSV
mgnify:FL=1